MVSQAQATDPSLEEAQRSENTPSSQELSGTLAVEAPSQDGAAPSPSDTSEARIATLEKDLERETQLRKTAEGRTANQGAISRLEQQFAVVTDELAELRHERQRGQILNSEDLTSEQKQEKLADLTEEQRQKRDADELLNDVNTLLEEYGVDAENAKVAEALRGWGSSETHNQRKAIYRGLRRDLLAAVKEEHGQALVTAERKVEEERKRGNQEERTLGVGLGSGGSSASASEQELVNRYGRGEAMNLEDMQKASDAMNKGIMPKASVT